MIDRDFWFDAGLTRAWRIPVRAASYALLAATSTTALSAQAQNVPPENISSAAAADTPTEPGDIIVTANRTEQKLQNVGISATVVSEQTLVSSGIVATDNLVILTPGLQIAQPGGPGLTSLISIRGISQNDFAGHLESPNSFYIDDAYQSSPSANTQPLYDVKRVEVLKGPQGTLFGRNSVGGLINILTNDPTDNLGGTLTGEVGNFGHVRVQGAVNVPISNDAQARLAFYKSNQRGYIYNIFNDTHQNGDDSLAFRGKLKVALSDRLNAVFAADYFRFTSDAANVSQLIGAVNNSDNLGVTVPGRRTAFGYLAPANGYVVNADFNGGLRRENASASAKFTYELGFADLVSQTKFGWAKSYYAEDNDSSPLDYTRFYQRSKSTDFTQELRLTGQTDKSQWTVGVYYLNINGGPYTQRFEIRDSGPALIGQINAALDTNYDLNTSSISGFAQYAYNLSDNLTLTGGIRYTSDHKKFNFNFRCDQFAPGLGCAIGLIPPPGTEGAASPFNDSHTEGGVSGKVGIEYKPVDDLLLYATYSRGYKAFSYNVSFSGLAPLSNARFRGEKINAFEIGEKFSFLGGRGKANLSAFYYDYKDYQAFDQRGLNLTLFNTTATIKGLEADTSISGGGWTVGLAGTLLDTKVNNVPLPNGPVSRRAPQAPKYTVIGTINKVFSVGSGEGNLNFSAVYSGSSFAQLTNSPNTKLPANVIGNARLSYSPAGGQFEVAVYSRNIFNNRAARYAFDLNSPLLGATESNFGVPRTYGGSLTVNF